MLAKKDAIEKLSRQAELANDQIGRRIDDPKFQKWLRDTQVAVEKSFGNDTRHIEDFKAIPYGLFVYSDNTTVGDELRALNSGIESARAILASFVEELTEYEHTGDAAKSDRDSMQIVENLCHRFHLVVHQLRNRHATRPTLDVDDEYDVQDLLHALLHIDFNDIRSEEWTPSYAGGCSRVDFLLKREQIVIECKKTRQGLDAKKVGEELMVDIQRYRTHPNCKTLVCFVYDPDKRIVNPRGLEDDLNHPHDGLDVHVIIAPG